MRFAEVVDSVESLKDFMKVNNITPNEIIIVWDEPYYDDEKGYHKVKEGINKLKKFKPKWLI